MTGSADVIELDDVVLDEHHQHDQRDQREQHDQRDLHDVRGTSDPSETPSPVRLEVASGPFGRHLGARLAAERRRGRRPLWVMATRSRGDFTVRDLRDAEAGLLPLDPDAVLRLADLYDVELRAALPPTRRGLEIGDGTITAGGVTVVFRADDSRSMVEAYFRLVRTLRAIDDSAAPVAARHGDLVEMVTHATRDGHRDGDGSRAGAGTDALERVLMMASAEGRVVVGSLLAGVEALDAD